MFTDLSTTDTILTQFNTHLSTAELEAIQDYVAESDNFLALHQEIQQCDHVLEAIEDILGHYASDLATTSTDIRALQDQSRAMNVKLRNRRALQGGLSQFVERVALLPSLIHAIMQSPPDSSDFSFALSQLSSKLAFVANDEAVRRSAAFRDVAPELERLRLAAVTRCRQLLLDQIYALRRPRAHIQAKQAALLRHKNASAFLRYHGGDIYEEVRRGYADKVAGKLLDIFRSYWATMERVEMTIATAEDVLGGPETPSVAVISSVLSSILSLGTGSGQSSQQQRSTTNKLTTATTTPQSLSSSSSADKQTSTSHYEAFTLGSRAGVLAAIDAPPLILHEAEAQGQRFPFEVLFRSISKLLTDTASHEFLFCCEFWGEGEGKWAYKAVFSPVIQFVQASLASAVQESYDPIALLLCIRINRELALNLARKAIPALDDFFDAVNLMLWPRLKVLLDMQLDSLKFPSSSPLPFPAASSSSGGGGGGGGGGTPSSILNVAAAASTPTSTTEGVMSNVSHLAIDSASLHPTKVHVIARRYAALTAAELSLHADFIDGPLSTTIDRTRYAVMNVLLTLSRSFPQRGRGTVFLIHNFSHVVAVLKDAATHPSVGSGSTSGGTSGGINASNTSGMNVEQQQQAATTQGSGGGGLGPVGRDVLTAFEESLTRATELYVDARLTAGAPQLIAFVKQGEHTLAHLMAASSKEKTEADDANTITTTSNIIIIPGCSPTEAAPVARDFAGRWERIVQVLNREIAQDFGNTATGRAVQQAAFTQLVLYWSRFLELVKRQGEAGEAVGRGAVSMASILYALKQQRL